MKSFLSSRRTITAFICLLLLFPAACGRKSQIVPPHTTFPSSPSGIVVTGQDNVVAVRWLRPTKNTNGSKLVDLKGVIIYRREEPEAKTPTAAARKTELRKIADVSAEYPANAEVTNNIYIFIDRGEDLPAKSLAMGVKYVYTLRSVNKNGDEGPFSPEYWAFTVYSPVPPAKLKVIPGDGSVYLEWEAVDKRTDGQPANAPIYYNVYRTQKAGEFPLRPVNPRPVAQLRYTDTTVKNAQTYVYTVRAVDAPEFPWHESENSPLAEATPHSLTAPAAPRNLVGVLGEEGFVSLIWDPSKGPNLAGYYVYRALFGKPGYQRLNDKPQTLTTYRDDKIKPGETYLYYVTAVDNATPPAESIPSAEVKITVPEIKKGK